MRLTMMAPAVLLLALLIVACGQDQARQVENAEPAADNAARTAAEEAVALDQGPRARETLALDAARAERGSILADANSCLDCHDLGEADLAPDLLTVLDARTLPWLRRQIADPEWMLAHDSITQQLYAEYGIEMVDMGVTADEADDILHYLLRETEAAEQ